MNRFLLIKIVYIILLLDCCPHFTAAQYADGNFTRYSVKDGLSDNTITSLQQDDQGYMWIGTDAGLNRFDGKDFKKFYQGSSSLQLPSGSIWRLKRFGRDELGILSKGGFQLLNTKNYSVKNFTIPDSSAFSTHLNAAWEAVQLSDHSFAVTTASGFYVFDKNGQLTFRKDEYKLEDIGKRRILYGRDFMKMNNYQFLVYVNEDGLALYDEKKKSFAELQLSDPRFNVFMHDRTPQKVYWVVKYQVDPSNYIFIPYRHDKIIFYNREKEEMVESPLPNNMADSLNWESKIFRLDDTTYALNGATNGFYLLHLDFKTGKASCSKEKFLRDYKVLCLFMDKDKRLWAGTTEGLFKQELQPPVISAYRYPPEPGKKFTYGFNCAFRYKDKLYAGRFSRSKGLVIINPSTMQLIKEVDIFGKQTQWNEIRTIEMYYPDTLWIGTNVGIVWYDVKTGKYGNLADDPKYPWAKHFSAVLAPARSDGYAWMCHMLGGKLVRYHIPSRTFTLFTSSTTPALPFETVKHVVYDAYGDIWIGGHSLTRWNNKRQTFDTLITVYGGANKFNDDIISLRADDKGSLWMHNLYNGLLEYKIREKKFISYSMKDGLPSDVLYALSPVIDNKIWFSANDKLTRFDTRTKQLIIFDGDDGLPEHKPSGRRIYFDEVSRELYLFCNEYLVKWPFNPNIRKDLGSMLMVDELKAGNTSSYHPEGDLQFKYNENNLTVNYSIIDFDKGNYQFAYRLDNNDPWTPVGSQRNISLSNLAPGDYSLQLRASGKPGIEKTTTLNFSINPPFWKTAWFIGLGFFVITFCLYLLYRYRVGQIRQRANLDKLLSQTEMKALQAQMNPHFIFNSLNSIREMILNNENRDASHYLSKFAHLIRITLDQSTRALVTLKDTIDYLQRYLEMEKIRNSVFTYSINVDDQLDPEETFLPHMLIQPFIENALWHGVTANRKDIHIRVDFKKQENSLVCTIDDNGIGINQSQKNKTGTDRYKPHGISNIKTRMRLLNEKYNLHGQISIRDKKDLPGNPGHGTLVTLQLPLEIKEYD